MNSLLFIYLLAFFTSAIGDYAWAQFNPMDKVFWAKDSPIKLKKSVVHPELGKEVTTYDDGDGHVIITRRTDQETITEERLNGQIKSIMTRDRIGITAVFFDDKGGLKSKQVYHYKNEENNWLSYLWQNDDWKLQSHHKSLEGNGACYTNHGGGDLQTALTLPDGFARLIAYQNRDDGFRLDLIDCGWYNNAASAVEGQAMMRDEIENGVKRGARCLNHLANAAPRRSASARFLHKMLTQFSWVFERPVTMRCGVGMNLQNQSPFSERIRRDGRRGEPNSPSDQTFTATGRLNRHSGVANLCDSESGADFLEGRVPSVAVNLGAFSGNRSDRFDQPTREKKHFHEIFHLAGFAHLENSEEEYDFMSAIEDCCFASGSLENNAICKKLARGDTFPGKCSWSPNLVCGAGDN